MPQWCERRPHGVRRDARETLNRAIQTTKKRAFGFLSFDKFRVAVLFRSGPSVTPTT
jgi:hypothetical protein